MKGLLIFLSFCLVFASPAQADRVDRIYQKAAKDFHLLYRDTPFRKRADNWIKTIERFKAISDHHPKHRRAPQSLLNIGLLYRSLYRWNHKKENLEQSIIYFRRLAGDYPKSKLADDGQYRLAENYETLLKDPGRAYLEYQKVVEFFPRGDFSLLAKKKLKELKPPPQAARLKAVKGKGGSSSLEDLYKARLGGVDYQSATKSPKTLVSRVDYWSSSDWSRMVINVEKPVHYKYQVLKADKKAAKGRRMYIDLYRSYLPKKFKKRIAAQDGLITQARVAQFNTETVRIVLDLASLQRIKVFHLELPTQYKVVIDILGESALAAGIMSEESTPAEIQAKASPQKLRPEIPISPPQRYDDEDGGVKSTKLKTKGKENHISLSKALGLKVRRIILDPGHGGRDPGALGHKAKEKHLALSIAQQIKEIIGKHHPNIEVLLTRSKDRYLSLEARTAYANQKAGDLFVSIHLNASRKSRVKGMETYFLNLSTDEDALALAAKENQTSQRGIAQLQGLLEDLMTNSKITESHELAQLVQNEAVQRVTRSKLHRLRNLGVKQAPFIVLLGANMPSILVETGFISNPEENRLLKSKKYRKVLSEGIYRGLKKYMEVTGTI